MGPKVLSATSAMMMFSNAIGKENLPLSILNSVTKGIIEMEFHQGSRASLYPHHPFYPALFKTVRGEKQMHHEGKLYILNATHIAQSGSTNTIRLYFGGVPASFYHHNGLEAMK